MRSRRGRIACALAIAAVGLSVAAGGAGAGFTIEEIAVEDPPASAAFAFTPDEISAPAYQRVHWSRGLDGNARHSITQEDRLFRLPPTKGDIDYQLQFSAGTFVYYCEIHGSPGRGMDGVVRVTPLFDTDPLGPNFDVEWANDEILDTGEIFDVRYRRQGTSKWKRWFRNTALTEVEFGLGDEPERAVEGRSYEFQVRSKDGDNPRNKSRWSPVLVVTP